MNQQISEKVNVVTSYTKDKNRFVPYRIRWQGRDYFVKKISYYHKVREGRDLYHVFHVTDGNLDFCLHLDAENLNWILKEVSDGYAG